MKTLADRKRQLILRLRRAVKVHRQFDVKLLENGLERQTCRTCKRSVDVDVYKLPGGGTVHPEMQKKLSAYRAQGSGIHGVCPFCSKERAKERYPLPEEKESK